MNDTDSTPDDSNFNETKQTAPDWREFDENSKPFQVEVVRPPLDAYEWYEAVITELAWSERKTLFLTTPVNVVLQSLVNRGATPEAAAKYLIEKFSL